MVKSTITASWARASLRSFMITSASPAPSFPGKTTTFEKLEHKLHKPCYTCSHKFIMVATFTTAIRGWLQKSGKKIGANQTRFGMVSDNLSTHPSGRKTSAAHFESLPTRRLVYNLSFTISRLHIFYYKSNIILTNISENQFQSNILSSGD